MRGRFSGPHFFVGVGLCYYNELYKRIIKKEKGRFALYENLELKSDDHVTGPGSH
jgi:hypothetical protein